MKEVSSAFQVQLPIFEGPFDLLLFFIERDELDIHEVPIAQIGALFFEYIQQIDRLDLDLSGDFIRVAARLIQIKARTLLPVEPDLREEEGEDPREALAAQLILYKKFKQLGEALHSLAESRGQQHARGNRIEAFRQLEEKFHVERSLRSISLHKLLKTYRDCYEREAQRGAPRPTHRVWRYPYTVPEQKGFLLDRLSKQKRVRFLDLLKREPPPESLPLLCVFNLLATLELWQQGEIHVQGGESYNDFYLLANEKRSHT